MRVFVLCALVCAGGLRAQEVGGTAKKQKTTKAAPRQDPNTFILVGAGNIAWCGNLTGAEATAKLIDKIPGTVFAAGDLAYNQGTYEEFEMLPADLETFQRTGPSPFRGTTSTTVRMHPAIFVIGAHRPAIPRRAITVSIWARGTSSL
jgi:hypothetical protein